MKKYLLACCALAVAAIVGPTLAKDVKEYAVNKIKYKNRGAYSVGFVEIQYNLKNSSGKTVTCKMAGKTLKGLDKLKPIQTGQERTYDLRRASNFIHVTYDNPKPCEYLYDGDYIPVGGEIRVRVIITFEDIENCRKADRVKFYYHPKGGTVNYVTKGTLYHSNRCQIQSMGGILWTDVQ